MAAKRATSDISAEKQEKKTVPFTITAPDANHVFVAGSFNDWSTETLPLKKGKTGIWKASVKLIPGKYEYRFIVDGVWIEDPAAVDFVANGYGDRNSLVIVEPN